MNRFQTSFPPQSRPVLATKSRETTIKVPWALEQDPPAADAKRSMLAELFKQQALPLSRSQSDSFRGRGRAPHPRRSHQLQPRHRRPYRRGLALVGTAARQHSFHQDRADFLVQLDDRPPVSDTQPRAGTPLEPDNSLPGPCSASRSSSRTTRVRTGGSNRRRSLRAAGRRTTPQLAPLTRFRARP
jgi:hypothetical protein